MGTSVAGTPSTISAASLALVANSSASAPVIINAFLQQHRETEPDHLPQLLAVVGQAGCDLAGARRVEELGREREHVGEHALAKIRDHSLAHAHHQVEARPGCARQHARDRHHGGKRGIEQSRVAAAEPRVHHVTQSLAKHQDATRSDDERDQRRGNAPAIRNEELPEAQQVDQLALGRRYEGRGHCHAAILAPVTQRRSRSPQPRGQRITPSPRNLHLYAYQAAPASGATRSGERPGSTPPEPGARR